MTRPRRSKRRLLPGLRSIRDIGALDIGALDIGAFNIGALAIATLGVGLAVVCPAGAEVIESAPDSFTVQTVYDVEVPPAQVYQALVGSIGSWWHPDHTFSGDSSRLSLEARPNGCFCEQLDAGGVRHMTVVYVEAGRMVRMVGGLGPLQSEAVAGAMSWSVEEQGEGARLVVTYKVSGSAASKLDEWAPAVDGVLGQAADRLIRFVRTGSPDQAGSPD